MAGCMNKVNYLASGYYVEQSYLGDQLTRVPSLLIRFDHTLGSRVRLNSL